MNKKILLSIISAVCALGCVLSLTACGEKCQHTYNENAWEYNGTSHWHAAAREHTGLKKDEANHAYENGICTVCGYDSLGVHGLEYREVDGGYSVHSIGEATVENGVLAIPANHSGKPVVAIGVYAFSENEDITSVIIRDNVKIINDCAFQYCTNLKSVTFGKGVTEIKASAFSDSGLESITIPDGVTVIEDNLLWQCYSLKTVNIGNGVSEIRQNAFGSCFDLESITAGDNNTAYSSVSGVLYNKAKTQIIAVPRSIKNIVVPEETVDISDEFSICRLLESIEFSDTLKSISDFAFSQCKSLKRIVYGGTSLQWNTEVQKEQGWSAGLPEGVEIVCSDKTITLQAV